MTSSLKHVYAEDIQRLKHHSPLKIDCQYNKSSGATWESSSITNNTTLKDLLCNYTAEKPFKLNAGQASERDTLPPWKKDISIKGISIPSSSEQTSGNYALSFGNLRQLSTPPCPTYKHNLQFTNTKWYSEDVGCLYNKELSGGNLRELTKQACLKVLPQIATDYKFDFKTKDKRYYPIFQSKRSVDQGDITFPTKRKVKGWQERFVHNEEVNFLKWAPSGNTISVRVPQKRPVVPSHWSYTPDGEPYTRVTLDSSSWEFKDVEQLFKTSMSNVMIKKIDRVQNPFMWENFQRKKDYMKAVAHGNEQRVNEKRLFHGTRPDSVEAICKENFDCRLSGSVNGAVYGRGSYFAVNASLSHLYTRADANKSRFMFLAKVLAGSYVKGDSSYRRPPPTEPSDRGTARYYDSCVDNKSEPTMFIVFDINQHYPEYVIQYQSD